MADVITTLHPEGAPEDNLYPNVKDENVPSSIERVNILLWENANPNARFNGGTTISLDLSGYSKVRIICKQRTNSDVRCIVDVQKIVNVAVRPSVVTDDAYRFREFKITQSGLYADSAYAVRIQDTAIVDNECMIPLFIYGIK